MTAFIAVIAVLFFFLIGSARPKSRPQKKAFRQPQNPIQPKKANPKGPVSSSPAAQSTKSHTSASTIPLAKTSIIDVGPSEQIPIRSSITPNAASKEVAPWPHQYIYSLDDLHRAGNSQRGYYYYFKDRFTHGIYPDLKGNTNYAFALLFDLLAEYKTHGSLGTLREQLALMTKNYPYTERYAQREYDDRVRHHQRHSTSDTTPLTTTQSTTPSISWYSLGAKHLETIPMNEAEARLLDNLYYNPSSFFADPFCQSSTVGLFLRLIRALDQQISQTGSTLQQTLEQLGDLIARKQFHYKTGSENYKLCIRSAASELRQSLMKLCENTVRNLYDYRRQLQVIPDYPKDEITAAVGAHLITPANELLPELVKACPTPDEKAELAINSLSPARWKTKFESVKEIYIADKDLTKFREQILVLGKQNKSNPAIENIFFDAGKFIGKQDKTLCLSLYAYYVYYDQRSDKIDDKPLPKTIQKAIFPNPEKDSEFNIIIAQLKANKDIKAALTSIAILFQPKRRKIQLNTSMIKEAEKELHESVDLLNEYLIDDEQIENDPQSQQLSPHPQQPSAQPAQSRATDHHPTASPYLPDLALTPLQASLLIRFERHRFLLTTEDIDGYARNENCFRSQLVNSINEACFECLDDTLIETENGNYIINEEYYKRLLVK